MHLQYPLETLVRTRAGASQLDFAREACLALVDTDEAIHEPYDHGLAIFAANEDALGHSVGILRDVYGDFVDVRRPKVRYMPGEPPHEPIMHVRITTREEYAVRVCAELRARDARILERCVRSRVFIVRAEAPLAVLLGLPAWLEQATHGDVAHAIRLLRYRPIPAAPGPEAA